MNRSILAFSATAIVLLGISQSTRADSIELVNGDLLHGKVVSLDDRELRLMSDIHGAVIIAREKVAAVGLGEYRLARPAAEAARVSGRTQVPARRAVVSGDGATITAAVPVAPGPTQDIVRQLRAQGLSAENIAELQKAMPMLKEPAAKKYFDDTVKGLVEGDLNVDDIRKQAIRARDEYRKSVKGLGPEAEKALDQALGGYMQILDRFIRDSDPKAAKEKQPPPVDESAKKSSPDDAPLPPASDTPQPAEKTEPR